MDKARKSGKKTASSSPNSGSKGVEKKILSLQERIYNLEQIGQAVQTDVSRSTKYGHKAVESGYKVGFSAGFNLMREYAKKVFPEGKWEEVDPDKATKVVGPPPED